MDSQYVGDFHDDNITSIFVRIWINFSSVNQSLRWQDRLTWQGMANFHKTNEKAEFMTNKKLASQLSFIRR